MHLRIWMHFKYILECIWNAFRGPEMHLKCILKCIMARNAFWNAFKMHFEMHYEENALFLKCIWNNALFSNALFQMHLRMSNVFCLSVANRNVFENPECILNQITFQSAIVFKIHSKCIPDLRNVFQMNFNSWKLFVFLFVRWAISVNFGCRYVFN